jgi:microcin C transport system substrate-binding protein
VPLSRRSLFQALTFAALPSIPFAAPPFASAARADDKVWRHGLSLFGPVKYPPGFKNFDYVNVNAPKGGTVRLSTYGTFDNFNLVIAGIKGSLAAGVTTFGYETLTRGSLDEISAEYGLLAEAVTYPSDFSSVTYRLRPDARWHDGMPVTADDVIYSLEILKKQNPQVGAYYRHVVKAEKTGDREITFTFDGPGNRELPQIVGQLWILPKHWWEGTDATGKKRSITETTLEKLLGSGPYRIKEFEAGRTIVWERVKDYWGKDLNVNVGAHNFDELRYDYYRDSSVEFEAFKGDHVDWRLESSAKNWATGYDFPAVQDGRVTREKPEVHDRGGMQAFAFNIRRDKFGDPRVRRAFNWVFDFEDMNKELFYGQYIRVASYFQGTELACSGLPQGQELDILQAVRDKVPPEVFTTPYTNPVGGSTEAQRSNLREALRLMKDAGYVIRDTKLVNAATGEQMAVELLADDPSYERVMLFFKPSLERLGVNVSVRTVDASQYENRMRKWDFDMVIGSWPESLSPGNEQRDFWSSQAADQAGSDNIIGIKNPAVDALIDRIIFAKNRDELVAATHALDRVLLWNFYVVPQWTYPYARIAHWDRFGHPDPLPQYGVPAFPTIWWWDAERAAKAAAH